MQLVEQYLARIEAYDDNKAELNSIIPINPCAPELAAQLDKERQRKGPRKQQGQSERRTGSAGDYLATRQPKHPLHKTI